MAQTSGIEWTETTWNPVTGCDRISPGCDNCYALTMARRLKAAGNARYQEDGDPRTSGEGFAVNVHNDLLDLPRRWRKPRLVFVNSMSDLFHGKVPAAFISRVFATMAETPHHTYQVLTKRPLRAARLAARLPWPPNVWLGVSVESPEQARRIDQLRRVPAAVRFISAEPLLAELPKLDLAGIHWLIVGGESGPGHRPVEADWVRDLRDQALEARVAFFFKQWGGSRPKTGGRELDGATWSQLPPRTATVRPAR
ncbi:MULTISPECIES: phage Gp37/Gp68 family protein [unclassified Glycomyces]|uniref:DUF5131 family protein n=1 Tax=Glycomyces sp. NRRL B-16210 TaxID=1463821 RepID=UPI0004C04EF9